MSDAPLSDGRSAEAIMHEGGLIKSAAKQEV